MNKSITVIENKHTADKKYLEHDGNKYINISVQSCLKKPIGFEINKKEDGK